MNEGTAIGAAIVALWPLVLKASRPRRNAAVRHADLVEPDAGMAGYYHERRAELLEAFSARGYPLATAALPPFAGDPRP